MTGKLGESDPINRRNPDLKPVVRSENKEEAVELKGVVHFHSETGTEGGYWAFQDERFIFPPLEEAPEYGPQWSYDGLHILKDGDKLAIYSKENPEEVLWSGEVSLDFVGKFVDPVSGAWVRSPQRGFEMGTWSSWFFNEHPAKLVKGSPVKPHKTS